VVGRSLIYRSLAIEAKDDKGDEFDGREGSEEWEERE
jgi:hypothetical protein